MPEIKCKSCGARNIIPEGTGVAVCEFCGREQTLTKSKSETVINLFNYANDLRRQCEFDKAAEKYEKILELELEDAEAHWGMVLCKYGIEYVEENDLSHNRIPTCHRAQYESVLADGNYLSALRYADENQKRCYQKDGEEIAALQRRILEVVYKEKPFDVFICYKEKDDETGERTRDSVIATELYYALVNTGFKVFFAPVTLDNKAGQEYEPYIFAALNSSKVMLVLGTKKEYMQAVWVRNEWSRFLKLMKSDKKTTRMLIPCYKDMDPYDMPSEFSHLQAKNMGDFTFSLDITAIIRKVIASVGSSAKEKQEDTVDTATNLLRRAFICLEDGEFDKAEDLLDRTLEKDPNNPKAYLGKTMLAHKIRFEEDLEKVDFDLFDDNYFKRAMRLSDEEHRLKYVGYRHASFYNRGKLAMQQGNYARAKELLSKPGAYLDAQRLVAQCDEQQSIGAAKQKYDRAVKLQNMNTVTSLKDAIKLFTELGSYSDAAARRQRCIDAVNNLRKREETAGQRNMMIEELQNVNYTLQSFEKNQQKVKLLRKWKKSWKVSRWLATISFMLIIICICVGMGSEEPPPAFIVGYTVSTCVWTYMAVFAMVKWVKVNEAVSVGMMFTVVVPVFMFVFAMYANFYFMFKPLTLNEKAMLESGLTAEQEKNLLARRETLQQQITTL